MAGDTRGGQMGRRPGPVVDLAREFLGSWGYLKGWPALLDKRKSGYMWGAKG